MIAGLVLCGTGTLPGDSVRFHGSLSPAEIWSARRSRLGEPAPRASAFSRRRVFLMLFSDQ